MKNETIHEYLKRIAREGGKKRAAKHTKAELSQWGKEGGRGHKKSKKGWAMIYK